MSQWDDDSFWLETGNFIKQHLKPGDRLLAPVLPKGSFPNSSTYSSTHSQRADQFEWIVFHKGRLDRVNWKFLQQVVEQFHPVFANEVFVIFTKNPDLDLNLDANHLESFLAQINFPDPTAKIGSGFEGRLRKWQQRIRAWLGTDQQAQSNAIASCIKRVDHTSEQLRTVTKQLRHLEELSNRLEQQVKDLQEKTWQIFDRPIAQVSWQEFHGICRNACKTTYLGNNTIICRVLGKYLLYADSEDLGIVPHLCSDGFWETWMTLAVARILQPGWHCIDVGANHGYYTLLMADAIGVGGRILALEPNPKLANLLQKTIDVNGFSALTTVVTKAVIDRSGTPIHLVIPKGRGMNASVLRSTIASDEVIEVATTSIDELTQDWAKVDFIKIDAEGAEEIIWQGLRQTVQRHPQVAIVLEINCSRYLDAKAFLENIAADGFALRHIDFDAEIKPLSIEQCLTERHHEDWLLFLQKQPAVTA